MASYKTAMGKVIDMGVMSAKNELVRAVGNAKMNARGDKVDSQGRVVKPAPNKVNEIYSRAVGNKSAQVTQQPKQQTHQLSKEEMELEDSMQDDIHIEKMKASETKPTERRSKK